MTETHKRMLLMFAALLALQAAFNLLSYLGALDGGRFGGDFISFWNAAQHLHNGEVARIYDPGHWQRVLASNAPTELSWFVYPPFALFGLLPLGGMSYGQAVLWWSLAPLSVFLALLWLLVRRSGTTDRRCFLAVAAFSLPLLSANLFSGQTGTMIAVLLLAATYFWQRQPLLAGIFIGLIAIKPQMGLLLPFALAASGQWRIFAAAATTTGLLAVAATAWLGSAIWSDYLAMSGLFGRLIAGGYEGVDQLALSPYVSLEAAGMPWQAAAAVQGVISLAVLTSIGRVFSRAALPLDHRLGILAAGSLLATPYALTYDMPVLGLCLVALLSRAWRTGMTGIDITALAMLTTAPFAPQWLMDHHVPFAFSALLITFIVLHRRPARATAAARGGVRESERQPRSTDLQPQPV